LLLNTGSVDDAAAAIVKAGLADELRGSLPAIAAAARRPAGVDGVREVIFPWFATYPQPPRSDGELEAFWRAYIDTCGDLSTEALVGGMKAWAAMPESEFLPKPGRLRELAFSAPTSGFKLYTRAHDVNAAVNRLLGRHDVQARMERDHIKPESQRQAVQRMLEEVRAHPGFPPQPPGVTYREWARRCLDEGLVATAPKHGPGRRSDIARRMPTTAGRTAYGSHLTPELHHAMGWAVPKEPDDPPVTGHLGADDDTQEDWV
jgi:hypothetical protein